MTCLRITALTILAAAFALTAGRAELPPDFYIDLQKRASEALTIKVKSVKVTRLKGTRAHPADSGLVFTTDRVEATADVVAVTRSKSGLKKGATIKIVYEIDRGPYKKVGGKLVEVPGFVGPSEPPLLKKSEQVPAYLSRGKDGTYGLAAAGQSFKTIRDR